MTPRGLPTVGEFVRRWAERNPARECVVDRTTGRRVTYGELEDRSNQFAAALARKGIERGSVIALHSENRAEFVEVLIAAAKLGAVVAPLNTRLTAGELQEMMAICSPALLVGGAELTTDPEGTAAATGIPFVRLGDEADHLMRSEAPTARPIGASSEDPYLVLFTSGSTGHPKGSISTHANHYANFVNVAYEYFETGPTDIALNVAPMFFSASLGGTVLPFLMGGQKVVIERRVEFGPIVDAIATEGCTCTQLVPLVIYRLLNEIDSARDSIATLRRLGYGSAPIPPSRLAEAIAALGRSIFVQGYGATETIFATALKPADHDPDQPELLASCGRPLLGARVDLRALDGSADVVEDGQDGEVIISGPVVSPGYWNDVLATQESYSSDGWFRTGDVARRDKRGYYYVVDRTKDMVISGGINIYPREVENVIARHPDVAECAVIGVPDATWGESVKAFVVARDGRAPTEADIVDLCRSHLASYKKPRTVEIVVELPKTATGKIDKMALRGGRTTADQQIS
jgi:fatty-acyl-CoA synthase